VQKKIKFYKIIIENRKKKVFILILNNLFKKIIIVIIHACAFSLKLKFIIIFFFVCAEGKKNYSTATKFSVVPENKILYQNNIAKKSDF
jgi:hypothetical protein